MPGQRLHAGQPVLDGVRDQVVPVVPRPGPSASSPSRSMPAGADERRRPRASPRPARPRWSRRRAAAAGGRPRRRRGRRRRAPSASVDLDQPLDRTADGEGGEVRQPDVASNLHDPTLAGTTLRTGERGGPERPQARGHRCPPRRSARPRAWPPAGPAPSACRPGAPPTPTGCAGWTAGCWPPRCRGCATPPGPSSSTSGYGSSAVTTLELVERLGARGRRPRGRRAGDRPRRGWPRSPPTATRRGSTSASGGFELAGLQPVLVRAFNVLRQYDEESAARAWDTMRGRAGARRADRRGHLRRVGTALGLGGPGRGRAAHPHPRHPGRRHLSRTSSMSAMPQR